MTVSYESTALAPADGVAAPLAQAGKTFAANAIAVLAALITATSYLLPILGLGWLVWWLARRRAPKPAPPAAGQSS